MFTGKLLKFSETELLLKPEGVNRLPWLVARTKVHTHVKCLLLMLYTATCALSFLSDLSRPHQHLVRTCALHRSLGWGEGGRAHSKMKKHDRHPQRIRPKV